MFYSVSEMCLMSVLIQHDLWNHYSLEFMSILLALLIWQDQSVMQCFVTSAYAHRGRLLALLMFCSGVRFSEISIPYPLLLLELVPVWSVQVDGSNRWALHMPSNGVSFTVTSLAYCLVFLDEGRIRQYSVFSGICDFSFCCPVCVF